LETRHSVTLAELVGKLYSSTQVAQIDCLTPDEAALEVLLEFDKSLGGPSLVTMNRLEGGRLFGRYEIPDRDVFRPLQYCLPHFQRWPDLEWDARDIVEMSCGHVEALVKRVAERSRWPFGQALRERRVRETLDSVTYDQATRFVAVYNDSKHGFDHTKDTHMFSVCDAVRAYFVARALGNKVYPDARLVTNLSVFDDPQFP